VRSHFVDRLVHLERYFAAAQTIEARPEFYSRGLVEAFAAASA
jgi:hypothetical protein